MRQVSLLQSAMDSYYKLRQLFYYKVQHGLLQIATGITKCDDYYKLRQSTCYHKLSMQKGYISVLSVKLSRRLVGVCMLTGVIRPDRYL